MTVDGKTIPMFPLGGVLLPGALMPLQVFEPRYRELTTHCLAHDTEFGVVLIARGHEVGGGEVRHDVGCLARIRKAAQTPDGRWGLLCEGTERIRVADWVADDPYPRAIVEPHRVPDHVVTDDLAKRVRGLKTLTRRTLALGAEAGLQLTPATVDLPDDAAAAVWRLGEIAPIGPQDRYDLLCCDHLDERAEMLARFIAGAREIIEFRLKTDTGGGLGA
ncbi:MAG: ATP-dependent protease [Actinomycetia bacterium]|nr:ATP-dependent protease [Actinomycetes bacterium]MCP4962108.1 ATP-dependent protease [Actinomycetes bacterium]